MGEHKIRTTLNKRNKKNKEEEDLRRRINISGGRKSK